MKFRIGIDIDDTICQLGKAIDDKIHEIIFEKFHEKVIVKGFRLPERYRFENGDIIPFDMVLDIVYNDVDWLNIPLVDDAVEYIHKLKEKKFYINFITHRSSLYTPHVESTTTEYLDKYFKDYYLHFAKDKEKLCYEKGIRIMIDNDHEVLEKIEKHNIETSDDIKTIFFTGAISTVSQHDSLKTFDNWKDLYEHLLAIREAGEGD